MALVSSWRDLVPSYSDQGFSEVESSVSLFYNYPVIESLKLYYDWYYLDSWYMKIIIYFIISSGFNIFNTFINIYD